MSKQQDQRNSALILPFINHRDHAAVAFIEAMSGLTLAYERADQQELNPSELAALQALEQPENSPAEIVRFASAADRGNRVLPIEKQRDNQGPKKPCLVVPLHTPISTSHTPSQTPTLTPPTKPRSRHSKAAPSPTPTTTANVNAIPTNRKPSRWSDLSELARFRAASEYTQHADGLAVSLNLSLGREGSYLSQDRQTKITRLFQNRLNRELKAAGLSGLPYALSFEVSPQGRLHLHGVVDAFGYDRDAVADALRNAAGDIPGRAKARQLKLELVHDGAGWASYVAKERKRTTSKLAISRTTIISQSMSRLAKQFNDERRKSRLAA